MMKSTNNIMFWTKSVFGILLFICCLSLFSAHTLADSQQIGVTCADGSSPSVVSPSSPLPLYPNIPASQIGELQCKNGQQPSVVQLGDPASSTPIVTVTYDCGTQATNIVGTQGYCVNKGNNPGIGVPVSPGQISIGRVLPVGSTYGAPSATASNCNYSNTFLGIPTWYKYLQPYERSDSFGSCSFDFTKGVATTSGKVLGAGTAFVLIGLAIVDMLLRVIGIVAVVFVIVGGARYILSQGEPDKLKQARSTIINALVGIAIAVVASGIVAFAGKTIGR